MSGTQQKLPVIGITMGDPVGIGPEIIVKALASQELYRVCRPVVLGDASLVERDVRSLQASARVISTESPDKASPSPNTIHVLPLSRLHPDEALYGQPTLKTGRAMAGYIIEAVNLAQQHKIDAMVTAPINKKALLQAGYDYPGHTEMLARLTGTQDVVMMLAGGKLRVALVTIHCALSRVSALLSQELILKTILITGKGLQRHFGMERPRIAVAGLNPHAGEEGLFGAEERETILPAVQDAQRLALDVTGPHPPDTVFYHAARGAYDAVVCMYHDQGLIAFKLLHFDDGVNVTLGLPVIRTSVDHGTAYDLAGKGTANPASMLSAIKMAAQILKNARRKG